MIEIKQKYGLDEFVLYVSNIYKYKNFFELIHAFSLIKEQVNAGLKLALVGKSFDDQYTESLKTLVSSKGLEDRVIFLDMFLMKNCLFYMCFVNYSYTLQHVKIVLIS